MPFDFHENPVSLYGTYPDSSQVVDVSIYGWCQCACAYCFANLNRAVHQQELNLDNPTEKLFRKLEAAMADELNPIGWFLREKYPVVFSNTTDPFQRAEKEHRSSEAFLKWCRARSIPVYIQTRGNVLLEEFERYSDVVVPGKDAVYLSICQVDDADRKRIEPGAMSIPKRWELARKLSDRGVPVVASLNPYLRDWVPDFADYCRIAKESGCVGVWFHPLHFSGKQAEVLAKPYAQLVPKSNLQDKIAFRIVQQFAAIAEDHGLLFYPGWKMASWLGFTPAYQEAVPDDYFHGRTMSAPYRIMAEVAAIARQENSPVAMSWEDVVAGLNAFGFPDFPTRSHHWWRPFNNQVNGDWQQFKYALGEETSSHAVLRYYWNHPETNPNFLWNSHGMQALAEGANLLVDDNGDLISVYTHGLPLGHPFEIQDTDDLLAMAVWPDFSGG